MGVVGFTCSSCKREIEEPGFCGEASLTHTPGQDAKHHPVVQSSPTFHKCVKMVLADSLNTLTAPWPRCQDLPQGAFKTPQADDLALAVSHGWPFQTHPDPVGDCASEVRRLVQQAVAVHKPTGDTVVFYDFTCVSQRPFCHGQADRTLEEVVAFKEALACMPKIFLLVDAVLHVDVEWSPLSGDADVFRVDAAQISGASLSQVGLQVQVTGLLEHEVVRDFDLIMQVGSGSAEMLVTVLDVSKAVQSDVPCELLMRRSPYGVPNTTPMDDRGWVYLERFVSMVKVAMVDETQAGRVVFSNNPRVIDQILEGGSVLRKAAQEGEENLREALSRFHQVLATKSFTGSSTDKLMDTNFGKNFEPCEGNFDGDRAVVARIMQEMVKNLPSHWAVEAQRQRQRQLVLAVNRGDAVACAQLLAARANVNQQRSGSATALHVAARHRDISVAKVLLEFDADCSAQDTYGDTPAHWVPLFEQREVLDLFDLLTPSLQVLCTENVASVSPFERYATWAQSAHEATPYQPAQARVLLLQRKFPSLSLEEIENKKRAVRATIRQRLPVPSHVLGRVIQRCAARGKAISLSTWEPLEDVEVTVLWTFAAGAHGPWPLYKAAFDFVARHLCDSLRMRLVVLPLHECFQVSSSASWSEFCSEVATVIEALPLPEKFVLIQEGPSTSLSWRLQHRLAGFLCLNQFGVFDEDFFGTDAFSSYAGQVGRKIQWAERRDAHSMATDYMRRVTTDITPQTVESCEAAFEACTQEEWDFLEFQYRCLGGGEYTNEVAGRPPLHPPVPGTVVMPARSVRVGTQNSGILLHHLMTNAQARNCVLTFLPRSSGAWGVEGEGTQAEVSLLLKNLLLRVDVA